MSKRPADVNEIMRRVNSGVDFGAMAEIRTLLDYIQTLEAERNGLASWLDTLRDLPDGASLRDYREDMKKWGE